jgi:DNA repair protein RadC
MPIQVDGKVWNAKEFKVISLRDCPMPHEERICDTPERVAEYWKTHVCSHPYFNPDVECFVTLLLTTRRHIKGHVLISTGTLDTLLVHPREVFRPAIVAASAAIVLVHNHPSGVIPHSVLCRMVRRSSDFSRSGQRPDAA